MIGIVGGSGLYEMEGLSGARWERVTTPFGDPSDAIFTGVLDGQAVAFLPRHGRGHPQSPTTINYRANIHALKQLGVTDVISLSAVGSLDQDLEPGSFVIVDQFVDRTFAREKSFFGTGMVAHVSMAEPVCGRIGDALEAVAAALDLRHRRGGTYLVMEGPQFSTRAESELYRSWGHAVIGMTNMPEAKLAREAEMCYATVAMVTDYDCWHPAHAHVTVDQVVATLQQNAANARALVRRLVPALRGRATPCPHGCDRALDAALITAPAARDPAVVERLRTVAGRVL